MNKYGKHIIKLTSKAYLVSNNIQFLGEKYDLELFKIHNEHHWIFSFAQSC